MRHTLQGLALAAITLCVFSGETHADSIAYPLSSSWQLIASAGQTVDVQSVTGAVVSTSASGAPATSAGQSLAPNEHRFYTLTADLYGRSGLVVVTSGLSAGSAAQGSPAEASTAVQSLVGLTLLDTVAAGTRLGAWFFQNQSTAEMYVALDDGAGNALSVFAMDPAAGAGRQGASMGSADTGPHVGRIRVFGAAGAQHALRVQ